jgi:hypothetical protein
MPPYSGTIRGMKIFFLAFVRSEDREKVGQQE